MATVKLTLDKRQDHMTSDGKHPLVLRLGHRRKSRDIPFDIHLKDEQFNPQTGNISGILNAARQTKRTQNILSQVDLWIDENAGMIKLQTIEKLKQQIEKKFFKAQIELTLLDHAGRYLYRLVKQGQGSTADSYEGALKIFVKYNMKVSDFGKVPIKTLYDKNVDEESGEDGYKVLPEYKKYDMAIKTIDVEYGKSFRATLLQRLSRNTVGICLRSIHAILNDAGSSFPEDLQNHKPLTSLKKGSFKNTPNDWSLEDIDLLRRVNQPLKRSAFDVRNYFLFMFGNMGMNFYDIALLKCFQFDGERIKYFRKKTEYEGDFFSIRQNKECLEIIKYYIDGKQPDDYIFPILNKGVTADRLHVVKNNKLGWFNDWVRKLAKLAGIKKDGTSYTPRDSWTNIGLKMGVDIRKISSGLGHSSIAVTDKHYGKAIAEEILDQVNKQITEDSFASATIKKEEAVSKGSLFCFLSTKKRREPESSS